MEPVPVTDTPGATDEVILRFHAVSQSIIHAGFRARAAELLGVDLLCVTKEEFQAVETLTVLMLEDQPAYSFTGDSHTGMYSPGADAIEFTSPGMK